MKAKKLVFSAPVDTFLETTARLANLKYPNLGVEVRTLRAGYSVAGIYVNIDVSHSDFSELLGFCRGVYTHLSEMRWGSLKKVEGRDE